MFNTYVNPGGGSEWTNAATAIHGLHRTSTCIMAAMKMPQVWAQFVSWVDSNVDSDEHAVVIAYNGETCDLKWIWRLTQAPGFPYVMPRKLKYFLDPLPPGRQEL